MKILNELYYGNINPSERSYAYSKEIQKLAHKITEYETTLMAGLNDEQKKLFRSFDNCVTRLYAFDLELTGFYDHDEILSISIVDGNGKTVMNTLVKPEHTKKWKRTEKVHGITPDMVADAPLLKELIPEIKEIFENADRLIAYGVSTDYSHIKYIYDTEEEREALHEKVRCCANEFVHYAHTHRPDVLHASLTDAMACLEIDWNGIAHTSMADTIACRDVWERLFPYYYDTVCETAAVGG